MIGLRVAVAPGLVDEQDMRRASASSSVDDDAALAGGDVLALLQAEAADGAEGADRLAVVGGARNAWAQSSITGMPRAPASSMIGAHVAGVAEQVRDDDRLRPRR